MTAESPVVRFIRLVERCKGMSLESCVINVAAANPDLATAVLDVVGAWPSSEPAIRALQRHWR